MTADTGSAAAGLQAKRHMQSHRAEEKTKNKSDSETRRNRCLTVGAFIKSFKINCSIEIRSYFTLVINDDILQLSHMS